MLNTLKAYDCIIPSSIDSIKGTVFNAMGYLKDNCTNIDEDILFEIKVILNELLINAIRHGNKEQENKCVKLKIGLIKDTYALMIVEDEGEGYSYECVKNERGEVLCSLKESGRGVSIVENLCDRIKFNVKGNKIVVLKRICSN